MPSVRRIQAKGKLDFGAFVITGNRCPAAGLPDLKAAAGLQQSRALITRSTVSLRRPPGTLRERDLPSSSPCRDAETRTVSRSSNPNLPPVIDASFRYNYGEPEPDFTTEDTEGHGVFEARGFRESPPDRGRPARPGIERPG